MLNKNLEAVMFLDYDNTALAPAIGVKERYSNDTAFLDDVVNALLAGHVEFAMSRLRNDLYDLYASTSTSEWEYLLNNSLLKHPLMDLLMQDPVTARSYQRPRGYPGDAKLLDMIYSPESVALTETTPLGLAISRYVTGTSLSATLRRRLDFVGKYISDCCEKLDRPDVLSVASGHCREIDFSRQLSTGIFGRFVALDSDPKAGSVLDKEYGHLGITPAPLSVSDILKGGANLGTFDLIYSAGLYDYLSTRFAQRLTSALYRMLKPGGTLMIINIAVDYPEIGYMESYMNWPMIGRSEQDTLALADTLVSEENAILRVNGSPDISSHYHVLEIRKR
jgi:SAM-dependent methyltransferase